MPENVDLSEIRALLGAAQDRDEMLGLLIGGNLSMTYAEEDGFEVWDTTLTVRLSSQARKDLLLLIGDY